MPKMKTHSGAKKRFRVTGSGKIMHERAGKRHLLERKSSRLTRGEKAPNNFRACCWISRSTFSSFFKGKGAGNSLSRLCV